MDNKTNQVLSLGEHENYYIIRQALYKGTTYYLAAELTEDEEDFTDVFKFFERVDKDGKTFVKEVKDQSILEVLAKNIKIEEE